LRLVAMLLAAAALIPAGSAYVLSTARTPVVLRATTTMMSVESWYDQGTRLSADQGSQLAMPAGMKEKALAYEADIAEMKARIDGFPKKEGTMYGILRDKLKVAELMLAATIESAPDPDRRREAYYCNDQGCWVAEQYFCDETGCWITEEPAEALERTFNVGTATKELDRGDPSAPPEKAKIVQEGIFAPAVKLAVKQMGRKELNAFRASVIAEHTKVISAFVDTSESKFGQIALKTLFEAADDDGNGTLDKQEVKAALNALGFTFIEDKQVNTIFKRADVDKDEVIDFEEFVKETPKTLKTSLVKLAKKNGHDLGFLA